MDNTSGRRWARFALIVGATMSVLGNETHTVLTPGHLHIVIRMLLAAAWPVALFVAVEVFVRVNWRHNFIDYAGRAAMLGPVGAVAAIVSYQHIHGLLLLNAEDWISALIGPVAIDGLMIGGTVALLAIRAATLAPAVEAPDLDEVIDRYFPNGWDAVTEAAPISAVAAPISAVPVSVAPISASVSAVTETVSKPRVSRGEIAPALKAAVSALISGETPEIGDGASRAVIGRYGKVLRTLRDNPNAEIDTAAEKVKPELVDMIRGAMREVAVR